MRVAIVGMGYVGLPLALQFGRCGVSVIGLDIDSLRFFFVTLRLQRDDPQLKECRIDGVADDRRGPGGRRQYLLRSQDQSNFVSIRKLPAVEPRCGEGDVA